MRGEVEVERALELPLVFELVERPEKRGEPIEEPAVEIEDVGVGEPA